MTKMVRKRLNLLWIGLLLCMPSLDVFAQTYTGDCIGAIPVCQPIYDVPTHNGSKGYDPGEISNSQTCLSNGEEQGVWYTFTVQTTGILNFSIKPYVCADDYDWILFDLTNNICSDIYGGNLDVSCNFSGSTTNCGITGPNGGSSPACNAPIPVQAGQVFMLYISNFSGTTDGYVLDFTASTAKIPDYTPPSVLQVTPNKICNADQLIVQFSENVLCASIQSADFDLVGPGGNYTVTSVYSAQCAAGAQFTNKVTLTLSPAIHGSGTFTLQIVGSITDVCSNVASGGNLNFNYSAMDVNVSTIDSDCKIDNGSATIIVTGGVPAYSYLWNTTPPQYTPTAIGLGKGYYNCHIVDQQGCYLDLQVYIGDPTSFTYDLFYFADTCSKGSGKVSVVVKGTTPPYTYVWNGFGFNSDTTYNGFYTGFTGDSSYTISVIDSMGCQLDSTFIMTNTINDLLKAYYVAQPQTVDFLFPFVTFTNQSENYIDFHWELEDSTISQDEIFIYEFPDMGEYIVSIIAKDKHGCLDTFTRQIDVIYNFSFYAPNSFTPNMDNLNDEFTITGVGIDSSTFEMTIFNRWGEQVFYTTNYTSGWNGSVNGRPPTASDGGVYIYKVNLIELNGNPRSFVGRILMLK